MTTCVFGTAFPQLQKLRKKVLWHFEVFDKNLIAVTPSQLKYFHNFHKTASSSFEVPQLLSFLKVILLAQKYPNKKRINLLIP